MLENVNNVLQNHHSGQSILIWFSPTSTIFESPPLPNWRLYGFAGVFLYIVAVSVKIDGFVFYFLFLVLRFGLNGVCSMSCSQFRANRMRKKNIESERMKKHHRCFSFVINKYKSKATSDIFFLFFFNSISVPGLRPLLLVSACTFGSLTDVEAAYIHVKRVVRGRAMQPMRDASNGIR